MEEVEIVFEGQGLRAKFGAKPRKVTLEVAEQYERKGWAKIIRSVPIANPAPNLDEMYGVNKETDRVSFMPEDKLIDLISWIANSNIPRLYERQAEEIGINLRVELPGNLNIGGIVMSKLIVVSSDMSRFTEDEKRRVRVVLFQKRIPYIYRIETACDSSDLKNLRQIIVDAKKIFFADKNLISSYTEDLGDLISDWYVEKGPTGFWRTINEVLKEI
jgi:hypothetical protein